MNTYEVYTDGSVYPNPGGVGGWASIIVNTDTGEVHEISGFNESTTNNRMELQAVIETLEFLPPNSIIKIYSDSEYVVNSVNTWMYKWIQRRMDRKNMDLFHQVYELKTFHKNVELIWVRGHNGTELNERADSLCNEARVSGEEELIEKKVQEEMLM